MNGPMELGTWVVDDRNVLRCVRVWDGDREAGKPRVELWRDAGFAAPCYRLRWLYDAEAAPFMGPMATEPARCMVHLLTGENPGPLHLHLMPSEG